MHLQTGKADLRLSVARGISTWDEIIRSRDEKNSMHSSAAQCFLLGCQSRDEGHSRRGALLLPPCCPFTTNQNSTQDRGIQVKRRAAFFLIKKLSSTRRQ